MLKYKFIALSNGGFEDFSVPISYLKSIFLSSLISTRPIAKSICRRLSKSQKHHLNLHWVLPISSSSAAQIGWTAGTKLEEMAYKWLFPDQAEGSGPPKAAPKAAGRGGRN